MKKLSEKNTWKWVINYLRVGEESLFDRGDDLLRAGEEDEDEEALEGVEDEEDVPDVVNVQRPGDHLTNERRVLTWVTNEKRVLTVLTNERWE